jgi:hypothetical protein
MALKKQVVKIVVPYIILYTLSHSCVKFAYFIYFISLVSMPVKNECYMRPFDEDGTWQQS